MPDEWELAEIECIIIPKYLKLTLPKMDNFQFYVYIMTDEQHSKLYTGRTGNLKRRTSQHRTGNGGVFTSRYNMVKLVFYELVDSETSARIRERQIKRNSKKYRVSLIVKMNPEWNDLYDKI